MKTLILAFLTTLGSHVAMPQSNISAKTPIILKAPTQTNWQVIQALSVANGFVLLGQSKSYQGESKLLLVETDKNGKSTGAKEFPYSMVSAATYCPDKSLAFVHAIADKYLITKLSPNQQEKLMWQLPLKKGKYGSICSHTGGRIGVVTDSESYCHVYEFSEKGKQNWQISLPKQLVGFSPKSKIITLANGGYALISAGKIWGLGDDGQVIWQFESESEQIQWQAIKQIANGEVLAMGVGNAQLLDPNTTNAHLWSVAADGSKVAWATTLDKIENQEITYDFCEAPNSELMIMCQDINYTQLISLDNQHDASVVYSHTNENTNQQLKFLLPTETNIWLAIGNSWTDKGKNIIIQPFQQKMKATTLPAQKPTLYMTAIGVGTNLPYTKHDAEAIAQSYQQQEGKLFKKVITQVLTTDSSTKAGELAKAFELLSTQAIQNDDVVIVYFSGNGKAIEDDYLLLASDYNPAALRTTTLRMSQMIKDLDNIPGKKLILLDACYSGAAISKNLPQNISILASSKPEQASYENAAYKHGAFTQILLQALENKKADTNQDGYTTLNEMYNYAQKQLPILVKAINNYPQQPQLTHNGEDFIIFEK